MLIRIIAIGTKMPQWITNGFNEYAKRFAQGFSLELVEIPAEKRSKTSNIPKIMEHESAQILSYNRHKKNRLIALDVKGRLLTTEQLAEQLKTWSLEGQNLDFVIGGPDGLSHELLHSADMRWSLSPLTFPHPLVRVILVEQLYRALSILLHHPYHRE